MARDAILSNAQLPVKFGGMNTVAGDTQSRGIRLTPRFPYRVLYNEQKLAACQSESSGHTCDGKCDLLAVLNSWEPHQMSFRASNTCFLILVAITAGTQATEPATTNSSAPEIVADVVYGHKYGLALTLDVFKPREEPNGAGVLFMVSGGWYSRWAPPERSLKLFQPLTDQGFTVFAVRHGSSPKFSIPEALTDVRRSVRFIRLHAARFGVDPDRLGVFGMSAGGHLSLMLGTASDDGDPDANDPVLQTSDRVQAVVAFVAPTDLRVMVWEAPKHLPAYDRFPALNLAVEKAGEVSPLLHVSSDDPPTLLLVGAKDELVPIKHSQDIHLALKEKEVPSRLVVYDESAHGFKPKDLEQAIGELVGWFREHLED